MPDWRITLPATVALVLAVCSPARAQQAETVMMPLSFHGESGNIPIGACLQVKVRNYPETPWWLSTSKAGAAEKAMSAVVAALKAKNRQALIELSEPRSAKSAKDFESQIDVLLKQLAVLNVTSIRRAYEFDGFLVFAATLERNGGSKAISAIFPFLVSSNGATKYLPVRPEDVTFALVQDLAGRDPAADASICSNLKGRFTHRVALGKPRAGASTMSPSAFFLVGAPLSESSAASAELSKNVRAGMDGLATAAAAGPEMLSARMGPQSAARLKSWWATANEDERAKFVATLKEATPFFFFDAAPLVVVYTRSPSGAVDVLYFLRQGVGLVWTNAYRVTVSDRVFKTGPLFEAAKQSSPFSTFLLK